MLGTVMYYELPIFDAVAKPFEFMKHYDSDTQTIKIIYKNATKDEHQAVLDKILSEADDMLSGVTPEMSDAEKARAIYHALCSRMTYDDSALLDFERKDSYFAYLENSGVCITFANVYNQLLTQVGIKTTLAQCDYTATMGHAWSIITIDGKDYFCDPTFELSYDSGEGYRFFGMTYAERVADGLGRSGITAGRYYMSTVSSDMIADMGLD